MKRERSVRVFVPATECFRSLGIYRDLRGLATCGWLFWRPMVSSMTSRSIHLRHDLNRGCIFGIEFDRIEELSLDLIDLALQAIDGTKIEAVASKHGRYDLEHNAKLAAKLDQSIKELQCD
jgi:hypothetical protein